MASKRSATSLLAVGLLLGAVVLFAGLILSGRSVSKYQPGFSCRNYRTDSGETVPYILFLPHVQTTAEPKPVLLFLNGYGENGSDGILQLSNNLGQQIWDTRGRFPFIVVAPQMTKDSAWIDPRSTVANAAPEIVRQIIGQFGGDANRVYLTGPSSGGSGTIALASRHPKLFAAIAPTDCGGLALKEELLNMPFWTFYNGGDDPELVASARSGQERMLLTGHSPIVTEFDQIGHTAWVFSYNQPVLYDWFLQHRLSDRQEPPTRFTLLRASKLTNQVDENDDNWLVANHGDGQSRLLTISQPGDELHFQYRSPQTIPCEIVLLDLDASEQPATVPVAVITIPWPSHGGATICSITGETARGDALAQRTLDRRIWNDIRVSKAGGVCRVIINGARLMELTLPMGQPTQFAIRLSALASGSEQQFRYVRTGPHSADEQEKHLRPDAQKFPMEADAESDSEALICRPFLKDSSDNSVDVTLADIRMGWREIESAYENSEIRWQQKVPELLNWYNGVCLPTEPSVESRFLFCGADWDFHSSRLDLPDQIPEGLDLSPAVREYLPERESHLFIPQLFSRFSLPPPVSKFHPLTRQMRSGRLAELRIDSDGRTTRVILHQIPEVPSAASALLNLEKPAEDITAKLPQLNDRCLTLDQCGAMLALRPINGLFSGPRDSSLVEPSNVACGGVECKRVVDRSDDGLQERIWLVASQSPHQIIRYVGTAGEESVQIDIEWDLTLSPPRPAGWSSMFCWTTGRPTNYFSRSTVHRMESLESPQPALSNFIDDVTKLPVGTWVDDRTQNTQYLIGQDGKHRTITLAEQCWLPKVEELLQTESGKVNRLIERKILVRRWTSGVRGWILLATLSCCVVLVVRSLVRKLGK